MVRAPSAVGAHGLLCSDDQRWRILRLSVYELLALHSSIVVRSRITAIGHNASHTVRPRDAVNCLGLSAVCRHAIGLTRRVTECCERPAGPSPTSPASTCEPSRNRPASPDTIPGSEREAHPAVHTRSSVRVTNPLDSEAWRYEGTFTRWNRFKNGFPGLGIASGAFAVYCGYEYFFVEDAHHGDEHHGEAHH